MHARRSKKRGMHERRSVVCMQEEVKYACKREGGMHARRSMVCMQEEVWYACKKMLVKSGSLHV